MNTVPQSIPRPLVRANQWVIVLSVILTLITDMYWILAIPLISGILGVAFDYNPVMRAAKIFLKKKPSEYVPEDKAQMRFNQLLAIFFLFAAIVCYLLNWIMLAYVFSAIVGLAAFIAILGFCIGCFMHYQWSQYKYRRGKRA